MRFLRWLIFVEVLICGIAVASVKAEGRLPLTLDLLAGWLLGFLVGFVNGAISSLQQKRRAILLSVIVFVLVFTLEFAALLFRQIQFPKHDPAFFSQGTAFVAGLLVGGILILALKDKFPNRTKDQRDNG